MNEAITVLEEQVFAWTNRLEQHARCISGMESNGGEDAALAVLAESQRAHRVSRNGGLPEALLRSRLTLNDRELGCLWMLAAIALDLDARRACGAVCGTSGDATIDLLRRLVYPRSTLAALEELGPEGKLRKLGLIERADGGSTSSHESHWTWTVSRRLLRFLHGDQSLDDRVVVMRRIGGAVSLDELAASESAIADARRAVRPDSHDAIVVSGSPHVGRRSLLAATATAAGLQPLEIDARRLAKDTTVYTAQLRAIARECRLLARTPLIANLDALGDEERIELVGSELVALIDGPVLVTCGVQRPRIDWGRPVIVIEMQQPTSAQRAVLWSKALGDVSAQDVEHLATHYPLAPALISRAAEAAKARAAGRRLEAIDVYAGIRAVLDDRVGQFAKRVTVTQTWEDLVLPQDQVDAITELMARIRERRRVYEDWGFAAKVGKGLGTSALFSGPPGTGKTMVAALIARDLGLELYQVDLGKVVSKYIGETEKNLAALFDAAEAGHAVLLFDEADALFGKRTEVKSSNDRYANLETNYLLQRLESFTGICLLTSNHETNIDPAFLRRLSLHLRFELPDAEERAHLWRAMIPKAAPVDDSVDVGALARRFAMSGGYIRNAALRAAFLAANEESAITAGHLERAARSEYEGMGKIAASS